MLVFSGICPHCFKEVGFNGIEIMPVDTSIFHIEPPYRHEVAVFAQCPVCYSPVIGFANKTADDFFALREKVASSGSYKVSVYKILPEVPEIFSHVAIPEEINKAFVGAQKSFRLGEEGYYLAIVGCRTTLELAVKHLLKKERVRLLEGINELVKECIIPKPMGEWAHSIRVLGNESAHEAGGTKEEAEEVINFTRLFLEYVFVMPHKLETFRRS
ncbi:DUF4145 domain-containing protein [Aquifex pyrophilus]